MALTSAASVPNKKKVPTYCYQCVNGPDLLTVEVIDGANHGYQGRDVQLFETIHGWLGAV